MKVSTTGQRAWCFFSFVLCFAQFLLLSSRHALSLSFASELLWCCTPTSPARRLKVQSHRSNEESLDIPEKAMVSEEEIASQQENTPRISNIPLKKHKSIIMDRFATSRFQVLEAVCLCLGGVIGGLRKGTGQRRVSWAVQHTLIAGAWALVCCHPSWCDWGPFLSPC